VLWAFAVMRGTYSYSTQRVFGAAEAWLEREIERRAERVPPHALGRVVCSFAALGRAAPRLFSAAARVFELQRGMSRQDVDSVLWSYSRLGHPPPMLAV